IYEVVKITPEIAKIIVEDGNATQINEISQKLGFNNLRQSGLEKVQLGLTSILEVMRVTTNN
ncbi:type IV-A pilus assembly ATPase PilB, partial [Acinetobacter baumannii]|nr:type IV-A pilus assembly ATPase PilB [Acinetobacter baumannii]MCW1766658.1 type IV-A pilus assembly ATPase PilB [Acinetobacter baumannii]